MKLFGVGEKVADCIGLFALHHLQAFPMDTHMIQAMNAHYKGDFRTAAIKMYGELCSNTYFILSYLEKNSCFIQGQSRRTVLPLIFTGSSADPGAVFLQSI